MTDAATLEAYLHENIPLSRDMGVRVTEAATERVRLLAPLEPNLNHRETGFGGSISALAILSGWSLLWCRMRECASGHSTIIQSSAVEYLAPVTADFTASCAAPDSQEWERFRRSFERRGRGRIALHASIHDGEVHAASFLGSFVVLRTPG